MRWFSRLYGANPLHLITLIGSFALAGYAAQRLLPRDPVSIAEWFVGAVIGHDLLLFPLYAIADRSVTAVFRNRRKPQRPIPWVNYLRIPTALSGILLLIWFPLIFRLPTRFTILTSLSLNPYLGHWLAVTGVLFVLSALALAVRLAVGPRGQEADAPGAYEEPAPGPYAENRPGQNQGHMPGPLVGNRPGPYEDHTTGPYPGRPGRYEEPVSDPFGMPGRYQGPPSGPFRGSGPDRYQESPSGPFRGTGPGRYEEPVSGPFGRPGGYEEERGPGPYTGNGPGRHEEQMPGPYDQRMPGPYPGNRPDRYPDNQPGPYEPDWPGGYEGGRPGPYVQNRPGRYEPNGPDPYVEDGQVPYAEDSFEGNGPGQYEPPPPPRDQGGGRHRTQRPPWLSNPVGSSGVVGAEGSRTRP